MSLNTKTMSSIKREKYSIVIKSINKRPVPLFIPLDGTPLSIFIRHVSILRQLSKLSLSGMNRFVDFLYIFRKTGI